MFSSFLISASIINSKVGTYDSRIESVEGTLGSSPIPSELGTTVTGALGNIPFRFGIDATTGDYGYFKGGADSVTPFKSGSVAYNINTSGKATSTLDPYAETSYISRNLTLSLPDSNKSYMVFGKVSGTWYPQSSSLTSKTLNARTYSGGTSLATGISTTSSYAMTMYFQGVLPTNQQLRISIGGRSTVITSSHYCNYSVEAYAIPCDSTTTEGVVWS